MTIQVRKIPVSFLIRRSVRYLLVSHGFRLVQAVAVLAGLSFVLTGSRIVAIDKLGNRADIVAAIFITTVTIALLTALNRHVMTAIDRRFFREAYKAEVVLTELGEAIPTLTKTDQLLELVAGKIKDALHPENVTIFLNGGNAGEYVAVFSSDASKVSASSASQLRSLVLNYDEGLVQQLRESKFLNSVEFTEPYLVSQGQGLEDALSDHERRMLRAVRSSLLIPIASNSCLHGLISLGQRLSDLPYAKEDKRLLLVVAHQIATFIENMGLISRMAEEERIARELEMAAEVQRHLFPDDGLQNDTLEIYGTCLPARGVGGDYYDYFEVGDHSTGIAIADVAGKGISAALVMSTVQASLRCQLISENRSLADVVSSMNRLLQRSTDDRSYATFFLAQFNKETRTLTYVNAGHNPPMLVRRGAVVELLTTGGPIIGTFLNGPYAQETIRLQSGDVLLIYTDGITEALNPQGVEFGEATLRSIVVDSRQLPARESARKVLSDVLEWQGQASQHDDITLIVVRVK